MIYVLRGEYNKTGIFKVGFSHNPVRRVRDIQTNCPFKLFLVALLPGALKDEKSIHKILVKYKTSGEWFQDNSETRSILGLPRENLSNHRSGPIEAILCFMETNKNHSFKADLICDIFKVDFHQLSSYYHQRKNESTIRLECIYQDDLPRINFCGDTNGERFTRVISHHKLFDSQLGGYERFNSYHSRITPFNKHLVDAKWLEPKYPSTYFVWHE